MSKILYSILLQITIACAVIHGTERQPLLIDEPGNPYVVINMPPTRPKPRNAILIDEADDYIQELSREVSTTITTFPDAVTQLVLSYVLRNRQREEEQKTIQESLQYHRMARLFSGIIASGCTTQAVLGSIAIATNKWNLVPCSFSYADSFIAVVGTLISGVPLLASCGLGPCMDILNPTTNRSDEIFWTTYSICNTAAIGIYATSLAAIVGSDSPEGSAAVLIAGGAWGTLSATRLLLKSCLRSRALARRSREMDKGSMLILHE